MDSCWAWLAQVFISWANSLGPHTLGDKVWSLPTDPVGIWKGWKGRRSPNTSVICTSPNGYYVWPRTLPLVYKIKVWQMSWGVSPVSETPYEWNCSPRSWLLRSKSAEALWQSLYCHNHSQLASCQIQSQIPVLSQKSFIKLTRVSERLHYSFSAVMTSGPRGSIWVNRCDHFTAKWEAKWKAGSPTCEQFYCSGRMEPSASMVRHRSGGDGNLQHYTFYKKIPVSKERKAMDLIKRML